MQTLTITQPDDWHIHLRDGQVLKNTVADVSRQFHRAIVMPNLAPSVVNAQRAQAYRNRIMENIPKGVDFQPLMTLYLTDKTSPQDILEARESGVVYACKLYPAGATTNSDSGLTKVENAYAVFETMQDIGMPLLIHGEVTEAEIDIFDREKVFIDRILRPLIKRFPQLKVVLEHITTKDAVEFVKAAPTNIAATITAHHLLNNRNDMLVGGIRPHLFCLPILKRQEHQMALLQAATSGSPKFFLGTDSAPHAKGMKETSCGCAGCYTAHAAIELYAEAFEMMGALDKLEAFASFYGPDFYGLPRNTNTITLTKQEWNVPAQMPFGEDVVVPYRADESIIWKISET